MTKVSFIVESIYQIMWNMIFGYSEEIPTLLLINDVVLSINMKNGPYEL